MADLGPGLAIRPDSATHALVEPAGPVTVAEFQRLLAAARDRWVAATPSGGPMLTPDDLRTALTASDPAAALAGVARRELDAGRTRAELADALADLLPAVRDLPGYADGWDEHLTTLADRLTGWTRPTTQLHPTARE